MSSIDSHHCDKAVNVDELKYSEIQQDHTTAFIAADESVNEVIENYLEQLLIHATESSQITQPDIPVSTIDAEHSPTQRLLTDLPTPVDDGNIFSVAEELPSLNWDSHRGVDCLLFDVRGLKLAVPLCHLGSVSRLDQSLTPIPGQASWCLGVYRHHDQSIVVVDTARYLMPERCKSTDNYHGRYLLQLANQPWALCCQGLLNTQGLKSELVKWRGSQSKRPWLAGTVITEMCALLDVAALIKNFQNRYWQDTSIKDNAAK